jgi:hypothetical protein
LLSRPFPWIPAGYDVRQKHALQLVRIIVLLHDRCIIAKLSEIQQNVDFLLSQLQTSEQDKFAAHLYRSRREYRSTCERAGKSGKPIERCVISTFWVAEKHRLQRGVATVGGVAADW